MSLFPAISWKHACSLFLGGCRHVELQILPMLTQLRSASFMPVLWIVTIKKKQNLSGEMARWLRTHASLSEAHRSVSSTYIIWLTNTNNSAPSEFNGSGLHEYLHAHAYSQCAVHTHTWHTHDTYKHILQNNIDILKEKEKDSAREASGSYYMKIWLWQIPVLYHNVEVPIQVKLGFLQLICILWMNSLSQIVNVPGVECL